MADAPGLFAFLSWNGSAPVHLNYSNSAAEMHSAGGRSRNSEP